MGRNRAALVVLLTGLGPGLAKAAPVAVYQSEVNAAEYGGVYQEPLRSWLERQDTEFEVIGDETAADPAALSAYPLILASSSYLVPDEAGEGLAEYVNGGGRLLWFDSPARCRHEGLREALGIGSGAAYATLRDCTISCSATSHPVAMPAGDVPVKSTVGNWATTVTTGEVLYEARGAAGDGEAAYSAVVANAHGEGKTLLYNWVVWQNREPEVRALLGAGLAYMLADAALEEQPCAAVCDAGREGIRQPAPYGFGLRAYRRLDEGARTVTFRARLLDAGGTEVGPARRRDARWTHSDGEMQAAACELTMPTKALADGEYRLAWQATEGETVLGEGENAVKATGRAWAELREEAKRRRKLLEPLLVGTLGDYDAEPRTPEGRVDIPRLLEQIETAHMNMYDFLVWHAETDWEDFQLFLPEAKEAGIKVWVTLCPPSEQGGGYPYSEPYRLDFIKWADEIGKLAEEHDHLVAMVIDDFWSGGNRELYTPEYILELVQTLRAHSPNVAFLPTIYWPTVGDEGWIDDYGPLIDGIVFPYCEYETGDALEEQLAACREWIGPDKFLLVNVYAAGSGGQANTPDRTEEYMRKTLTVSREHADGVRIYCLPKGELLEDHRYRVSAELYEQWRGE